MTPHTSAHKAEQAAVQKAWDDSRESTLEEVRAFLASMKDATAEEISIAFVARFFGAEEKDE